MSPELDLAARFEARFVDAIRRIDAENACDPNLVDADGERVPHELLYARRVTGWVLRLCPEASEALLLAARCQHICRWMIPRRSYEMTRAGYLKWRADLKQFHAEKAAAILAEAGYPEETIERVRSLNLKKNLGGDPEVQTLEDALCLVTLQYQLGDLMAKTEPDKLVSILRKTWKKMSPAARAAGLELPLSGAEREMIGRALADPAPEA